MRAAGSGGSSSKAKPRARPTALQEDIGVVPPKRASSSGHTTRPPMSPATPPGTGTRVKPSAAPVAMGAMQPVRTESFSRAYDSWDFENMQGFAFKPTGVQQGGSRMKVAISNGKFAGGSKGVPEKTLPKVSSLPSIGLVHAAGLGPLEAQAVLKLGGPQQRFF